jgi:hypothetical protein
MMLDMSSKLSKIMPNKLSCVSTGYYKSGYGDGVMAVEVLQLLKKCFCMIHDGKIMEDKQMAERCCWCTSRT